jgi:broad-specificity NMP kinase
MKDHRSTPHEVSKEAENRNFDPGTALENLRAEVVDIEALARAAEAATEALPAPATDRQRVVFGRIQSLATKTSEQASASLHLANAQVTALAAQTEARRKAAAR